MFVKQNICGNWLVDCTNLNEYKLTQAIYQCIQKFWSGSTFPHGIWTSPARSPKGSPPSHWEGNKTAPGTYSALVVAAPHWPTETRSLVSKRATPGNLAYPRGKPPPQPTFLFAQINYFSTSFILPSTLK